MKQSKKLSGQLKKNNHNIWKTILGEGRNHYIYNYSLFFYFFPHKVIIVIQYFSHWIKMAAKETVIKYAQVKENTNANNRHLTKEKKW